MNRSYATSQDPWNPSVEAEAETKTAAALGAVVAGGVALIGGGLLAVGPYLRFASDEQRPELDIVLWPKALLLVALAGLVAAAGLLALFAPRRPFGTTMAAVVVAPAATLAAFQGPTMLDRVLSAQGRDSLRLGGWLVAAGAGVAALAAVAAFVVMVARLGPARGAAIPFLGALAAAGLLQWWTVSPIERDGAPLLHYLTVDNGGSVWPGVTVLSALALSIAAVTVASARSGAAAIGAALGATLTVGMELGARLLVTQSDLRSAMDGARLRAVPVVLTGVTAGLLLLLVLSLAVTTVRQAAESTEAALASWDGGEQAGGWESPQAVGDVWSDSATRQGGGSWSTDGSFADWTKKGESPGSRQSGQSTWSG